jgi:hypothetical protein
MAGTLPTTHTAFPSEHDCAHSRFCTFYGLDAPQHLDGVEENQDDMLQSEQEVIDLTNTQPE